MRRRGFTLVELATVITLLSLIVPSLWLLQRSLVADHARALADLHAVEAMRGVSEELHRDLRDAKPAAGPALVLEARCGRIVYERHDDATLWRAPDAACGGAPRAIAAHVASLTVRPGVVEIVFEEEAGKGMPQRDAFRLGLPEAP